MEPRKQFSQIKKDYESEFLSKEEFISKASGFHDQFYDYSELLEDTDIKEICIRQRSVEFIIGEERLKVQSPRGEKRYAPLEILNFSAYEPFESQILKILSSNAQTVIDIGANIGWFSLNFAKHNPSARIISFEPLPSAYDYLERNITLNNLQNRIKTEMIALSNISGKNIFVQPSENSTNSSFKNVANSENVLIHEVETTTIDEYFNNYVGSIDLIKCDVEGSEFYVFLGALITLEQHRPAIFSEMLRKWSGAFDKHPNDLIRLLGNIGYECFEINDFTVRRIISVDEATTSTNFIFLTSSAEHQRFREIFATNDWLEE